MNLGERLKQARLKKGITQDQLGEALGGLTGPTISAIEKGTAKSFRDPQLVLEAAKILDVSPIWLQFGLGDADLIQETVPLIDWEDLIKGSVKPQQARRRIGSTVAVSPKSFALKVQGNSMVAPTGNEVSFREGVIIVVDPEAPIKPNAYVIVSKDKIPMLRKLVEEGGKKYLQPLNQLFQQTVLNDQVKLYGVVRAVLQEEFD